MFQVTCNATNEPSLITLKFVMMFVVELLAHYITRISSYKKRAEFFFIIKRERNILFSVLFCSKSFN